MINSERYDSQYAADMRAIANLEICEQAGCELIEADDKWRWRFGQRSSSDQYCSMFDTKDETAAHFVQSREFYSWLRSRGVRA